MRIQAPIYASVPILLAITSPWSCSSTQNTPKEAISDASSEDAVEYVDIGSIGRWDSQAEDTSATDVPVKIIWPGNECNSHADCSEPSPYCAHYDNAGAKRCAPLCSTGCPDSSSCATVRDTTTDTGHVDVCMPAIAVNCKACNTDNDCIFKDAYCLEIGLSKGMPQKHCAQDCATTNGVCEDPESFICKPILSGDDNTQRVLCVPSTESCICIGQSEDGSPINGSTQVCENSNALGTCTGEIMCDGANGWTPCSAVEPAEEICDNIDNNCDGTTDEGLGNFPCEYANDDGKCTGTVTCQGEKGLVCDAPKPNSDGSCPGN